MAFWGVELKSKKPYIHRPDDDRGRLHVSQATLGAGSSTEKSIVQCKVGNKKPIYLCSLLPEKLETCALNLEFEEEDEVTFTVLGPCSVHLSGFFYGDDEDQDCQGDDCGSDAYEEDIMVSDSDGDDDSLEFGSEDEDEDEYDEFSDDIGMFHPAPNSGVTIEEIVDDEKPVEDGMPKNSNKRSDKLTATGNDNSKQIVLRNGTPVVLSESEDEDGFPLSSIETKSTSKPDLKLAASNDKAVSDKLEDKKDAVTGEASLQRKNNAAQDRKRVRETSTFEPSADSEKVKKKKNKKKGLTEKEEAPEDERPDSCRTEVSPVVATESDPKTSLEKKKNKKKKNKNDQQEASMTPKLDKKSTDGPGSSMEKRDSKEAEPFQQRSFPNGLVVEEVKMGKPDGKRASPGKKVSVHYIGKLKKTGKIFDSNIGKAPFKFRLGIGQVIKGWDVGVNGMRVGDKRRLTIPPAMGYGAKGCGPAIPPNSWLVFDVELVDVN